MYGKGKGMNGGSGVQEKPRRVEILLSLLLLPLLVSVWYYYYYYYYFEETVRTVQSLLVPRLYQFP